MNSATAEIERLVQARILIVEDEGIVAKDLQSSLRSLGYTVCGTYSSGADAVAKAVELRPDLVLMDIRLRGAMDGVEAARRIRAHVDVPIVFLTAYADPDTLARAADVGPYGYVLKPFDDRELQVTLIMAMCKHRAFAQLDRRVQERTAELARSEDRYRRLQSVAELGLFALGVSDVDAVMQRGLSVAAKTLDIDLPGIFELQADGSTLLLRAGSGWAQGAIGRAVVEADGNTHAGYVLTASEAVVVCDFRNETRFGRSALLQEHGVLSGIGVVIHACGPDERPYGMLGVHSRVPRQYSDDDINFLQALGNVIATAIMRSAADAKVVEAKQIAQDERIRAALAEDALRARDEFLSVAAHELRTPVAALHLQLEALHELLRGRDYDSDPRISEKANRARKTVERLTRLIEGVLDVSRIALGSLELERERFDLVEVVHDVVARHEDLAQRAGCELRIRAPGSASGWWDRVRLEQVITNLLSNALKFGAGKPVELSVQQRDRHVTLTVEDHGEGIDPADAQRILHRFERAVSHRHYGGLGLGLYIAGQIVQEHGGQLDVCSRPGKGAAFTVMLPRDGEQAGAR